MSFSESPIGTTTKIWTGSGNCSADYAIRGQIGGSHNYRMD
jgi:hypothetical protein